ncbi:hypothetical protein DPMN_035264 [Dreissena polymorpha]|uniref:Uncharacterized protein n=1 Tax=Dreissena polymorpha TaxID=45954 RepID=A0A9D4MBJ9_DREPO|nr:hypothetical protein DPMN_035264 [Dreissena polymorpha]
MAKVRRDQWSVRLPIDERCLFRLGKQQGFSLGGVLYPPASSCPENNSNAPEVSRFTSKPVHLHSLISKMVWLNFLIYSVKCAVIPCCMVVVVLVEIMVFATSS